MHPIFQFPLLGSFINYVYTVTGGLVFQFPLLGSREELGDDPARLDVFQFPLLGSITANIGTIVNVASLNSLYWLQKQSTFLPK